MSEKFQIINASAGSGKTFALATNVIIKILKGNEDSFKKILALTFTNNSANEMKKRILEDLKQISIDPSKSLIFRSSNLNKLFTIDSIKPKAKKVLNKILHNFSFFQVSTIDKFNHRLIRSFSSDLSLSHNFDLVIETDEFSDDLLEKFFNDLEKESFLSDLIIKYASSKHNNNKSWDIAYDIKNLLDIIWDENNYKYVGDKTMDVDSFKNLEKTLSLTLKKNRKKIEKLSLKIENQISGIDQSYFSYGTLPKFLHQTQSLDLKKIKTEQVLKRLENNTILKKENSTDESLKLISKIKPDIIDMILLVNRQKTYNNLNDNLYLNYLVYNIVNYSKKFQKENNLLLISDFNSLISENISDHPAPFIYEKIGTKYNNYFIDEFQDTSELQWKNLVPLASHSITNEELNDEGGNLFLVGDPKQSIYRFRGAKPETFTNLKSINPFFIKPELSSLATNYRSYSKIVDFNNKFFKSISKLIRADIIEYNYREHEQNFLDQKKGGYLSFHFIDSVEKDYDDKSSKKLLKIIKEKEKQGFNLSDIAILCRNNQQCNLVSTYLIENDIKVNSEELLALSSSNEVIFIIDFIRLLYNKNDLNAKKNILKFISLSDNNKNKYDFIFKYMSKSVDEIFDTLLSLDYLTTSKLELYLACEKLISTVEFLNQAEMQVYFLLDEIYNFCYNKKSNSESFLDYWETKKKKLKVNLIEETNAVKVLTIHKSKGLEFPIVILPYFDFKLTKPDNKIWVNFSEKKIDGNFLLNYNDSLKFFNNDFAKRMHLYNDQMTLDNINVMYVSLSRAILENHVICQEKNIDAEKTSGTLLRAYFSTSSTKSKTFYEIGTSKLKTDFSSKKLKTLNLINTKINKNHKGFNNYYKSDKRLSSSFGNIFHNIMSEIEYEHQSDYVINDYHNRGIIDNNDKKRIINYIDLIMNHDTLKMFFSKENVVYNEREIFIPPDIVIIPDKIVFKSDSEVYILDYKTGEKNKDHEKQLRSYSSALKKANYRVKGAFLVYISNKIEVLKIDD